MRCIMGLLITDTVQFTSFSTLYIQTDTLYVLFTRSADSSTWPTTLFWICSIKKFFFLFVWIQALPPSQQFSSQVWTFLWVEPVISNEDEESCSRTQHWAPGELRSYKKVLYRHDKAKLPLEGYIMIPVGFSTCI